MTERREGATGLTSVKSRQPDKSDRPSVAGTQTKATIGERTCCSRVNPVYSVGTGFALDICNASAVNTKCTAEGKGRPAEILSHGHSRGFCQGRVMYERYHHLSLCSFGHQNTIGTEYYLFAHDSTFFMLNDPQTATHRSAGHLTEKAIVGKLVRLGVVTTSKTQSMAFRKNTKAFLPVHFATAPTNQKFVSS